MVFDVVDDQGNSSTIKLILDSISAVLNFERDLKFTVCGDSLLQAFY